MVQPQIPIQKDKIADFCTRWKISELALFGSVLSNQFQPDSDVDILVKFRPDEQWSLFDFVDIIDELKLIFGRNVDLVEQESLINPFRRRRILSEKKVIYAA